MFRKGLDLRVGVGQVTDHHEADRLAAGTRCNTSSAAGTAADQKRIAAVNEIVGRSRDMG